MARFNRAVTNQVSVHLAGMLPGMGIVIHVGRRPGPCTGRRSTCSGPRTASASPSPTGGTRTGCNNALAHGAVRLVTRRQRDELTDPEVVVDPHRQHIPQPFRAVLRLLAVLVIFLDLRRASGAAVGVS